MLATICSFVSAGQAGSLFAAAAAAQWSPEGNYTTKLCVLYAGPGFGYNGHGEGSERMTALEILTILQNGIHTAVPAAAENPHL